MVGVLLTASFFSFIKNKKKREIKQSKKKFIQLFSISNAEEMAINLL